MTNDTTEPKASAVDRLREAYEATTPGVWSKSPPWPNHKCDCDACKFERADYRFSNMAHNAMPEILAVLAASADYESRMNDLMKHDAWLDAELFGAQRRWQEATRALRDVK